MQLHENIGLKGRFRLKVLDAVSKQVLQTIEQNNLVVTAGKTLTRNLLSGDDTTNYILAFAVGTGTTAPALSDTTLGTEVFRDSFTGHTNVDSVTVTFEGEVLSTEANGSSITEVGLFTNAVSGGTMLCRATFDAIPKDSAIELRLEYTIEIS